MESNGKLMEYELWNLGGTWIEYGCIRRKIGEDGWNWMEYRRDAMEDGWNIDLIWVEYYGRHMDGIRRNMGEIWVKNKWNIDGISSEYV